MTKLSFPLAAALALFVAPAFADDCADAWTADIQPVVNRCVSCHQNAAPAGKLSLQKGTAPANLIWQQADQAEMNYVTPGDPEQSYLLHKLKGTQKEAGGSGAKMPLGGQFSEADIKLIEDWILACDTPEPAQ